MNIGPGSTPQSDIPGYIITSQKEEFFLKGMAFTQSSVYTLGAAEVLDILIDPSNYIPDNEQKLGFLVAEVPAFGATAGPILIDFYKGTTVSNNGTPADPPPFNRNAMSSRTAQVEIYTGPTITDPGFNFSSIIVPSTSVGVNGTPAQSPTELPVTFSGDLILIRMTNENGAGTKVGVRNNWFEI